MVISKSNAAWGVLLAGEAHPRGTFLWQYLVGTPHYVLLEIAVLNLVTYYA